MKRVIANRYPYSALLFRVCREVLEDRNKGTVKVIDQDVGSILGYDPADCSHWKKGKKNISSLKTLKKISDYLGVNLNLLISISSGETSLEEALFEYQGYGPFSLTLLPKLSSLKPNYESPSHWQEKSFLMSKTNLEENIQVVTQAAESLLAQTQIEEAPVYIRELYQMSQQLSLEVSNELEQDYDFVETTEQGQLKLTLRCKSQQMPPYVRFLAARELFHFLLKINHPLMIDIPRSEGQAKNIYASIFARSLLIPKKLFLEKISTPPLAGSLSQDLAKFFWVSPILINQAFRELFNDSKTFF